MLIEKPQIYKEEFDWIFEEKGSSVRKVVVISAFIEGQILYIARNYLDKHNVNYEPESTQEYYQSINILKTNNILPPDEIKKIQKFRTERNKSIHGIFKGFTRDEWNQQNRLVIDLGRPIVKQLDEYLFPPVSRT